MSKYYDEFFKFLKWTDAEIESQRSDIENMLEKIDVKGKPDLDHAMDHMNQGFDLTIPGVRELLGIMVSEFVNSVNIRRRYDFYVSLNYPVLPCIAMGLRYAAQRTGKKLAMQSTTQNAINTVSLVFDKYTRILEAGELIGQAAGKAHCAQYQAEAGFLELGILPVPDLVVASGWFCDQGSEADELLSQRYGFESINLECTMDWTWGGPPDKKNMIYSYKSLERIFQRIKEVTGVEPNDEDDAKGWEHFGNVSAGTFNLIDMVGRSDPQCMSHSDVSLVYYMTMVVPALEKTDATLDAINMMIEEAARRIDEGIGVVPKGAPKVFVGMRTGCDMGNIKVIENAGLSITNMFIDGTSKWEMEEPLFPDADRYMRAIEFFLKRPGIGDVESKQEYVKAQVESFNADGALLSYLFNCRPYAISPNMDKDYFEKHTGKPALVLETDYYDSRLYSAEQQRTRVESFAEILKMNKAREMAAAKQ